MTRGDIWWTDCGVPYGSEPGFLRPAVIMQSNEMCQIEEGIKLVLNLR